MASAAKAEEEALRYQQERDQLHQEADESGEAEAAKSSLQSELDEAKRKLGRLAEDLSLAQDHAAKLKLAKEAAEASAEAERHKTETFRQSMQSNWDRVLGALNKMKVENPQLRTRIKQLEGQLGETEAECEDLKRQISQGQAQNAESEKRADEAEAQSARLQQELHEAHRVHQNVCQERDTLLQEKDSLVATHALELEKARSALQERLNQLSIQVDESNQQIKKTEQQLQTAETQLGDATSQVAAAREETAIARERAEAAELRAAQAEEALEQGQGSSSTTDTTDVQSLEQRAVDAERQLVRENEFAQFCYLNY